MYHLTSIELWYAHFDLENYTVITLLDVSNSSNYSFSNT